jgi:hypothetical protein
LQRTTNNIATRWIAFLALALTGTARGDLLLPEASQLAVAKQRIGLTDIKITYHRPLVGGRKVWGGIVPLGEVWRAGANENTTIEFSDPVAVEGQPLAKGVYGLHMIPNPDSWTVIFSKMASAWGSYTYNQTEDALRVNVKPQPIEMEEALTYDFEDPKPDSVVVMLKWEKTGVPFRIAISEAETTLPNIRNQLRGRAQYEWESLNDAAQFCLKKKINLEEGLKWVEQSIQGEERFENLETKADLLKASNRAEEAKTVWNRAQEVSSAPQLYSHARGLQSEKRSPEAMEILQTVAKRFPQNVFGHLAQARLKSAAGDYAGAAEDVKKAQAVAISDQQRKTLQTLLDRLAAKQDINK